MTTYTHVCIYIHMWFLWEPPWVSPSPIVPDPPSLFPSTERTRTQPGSKATFSWSPARKLSHRRFEDTFKITRLLRDEAGFQDGVSPLCPGPGPRDANPPSPQHRTLIVITASQEVTPKSAFITPTSLFPTSFSNACWAIPPACQNLNILRPNSSSF